MDFRERNVWISIEISLKFVPKRPINNIPALVNGLDPVRRQAIIWNNDGLVCWRIYASLCLNALISLNFITRQQFRYVPI